MPSETVPPPPRTDPLDALLRAAVRKPADPALRAWLRQLQRGVTTGGTAPRPVAPTAASAGEARA